MAAESILLLGGGGHGRVLLETLLGKGVDVLGVLDSALAPGEKVMGVPVLGGNDMVKSFSPADTLLANGLGSVGNTEARSVLYRDCRELGFRFAGIIHPSATMASGCEIRAGVQIMAGAVVQLGCFLGENSVVNTGAVIDHDCRIGAHTFVSSGAVLSGGVQIGEGAHIGAGATVIQGRRIGARALVAAGAVVVEDVAEGRTVKGVPAK